MVSYGFSKDDMLTELKSILVAEANISGRFFHRNAARAMFGLEPSDTPLRFDELDISDLHITRSFSLLYDFVMNAEWDMFGNLQKPFDLRVDVTGFIERALDAVAFEMAFEEFAVGGVDGAAESGLCAHIARAAGGRLKLCDPDNPDHDLTVDELAALAHLDVRTVQNAAKELDIHQGKITTERAEHWLASRRMYRPTCMIDSIDQIDPLRFQTLADLVQFVEERCRALGLDQATFAQRVGWSLDSLSHPPQETLRSAAVDAILDGIGIRERQNVDTAKLDPESWKRIAGLIDVNWIWLTARLFRTSDVFFRFANRDWYQRTIWYLWDAHQTCHQQPRILVPVAADGTWFHAGLRRRKGFLVGGKSDKHYVGNLGDALEELKEMPHAYWYRPNPDSGLWGVVKALSWKEIPESQVLADQTEREEGSS